MTKDSIRQSFKQIITDRSLLALIIAMLFIGLTYLIAIGFSIHPRDVQIYTRYTAFGEAHFYKSPWQYTLLFVSLGILIPVGHIALMTKLYDLRRRQAAVLIGWLGIVILAIAAVYVLSILRFAFR